LKKNFLLLITTVLVFYTFLEVAIWRNYLNRVPLTLHSELGRLSPFAQTSKTGIMPKDYIMILGDSYAEGLGDWLLQVVEKGNPEFNSAHVLHNLTGRDVISFGERGGFPSRSYVFHMNEKFEGTQLYAGMALPEPKDILVYYFEGNDVNDEIANLTFWGPVKLREIDKIDRSMIKDFINDLAISGKRVTAKRWYFLRNAHLLDTSTKLVKLALKNLGKNFSSLLQNTDPAYVFKQEYKEDWSRYTGGTTKVNVAGNIKTYPYETVEPAPFHTSEDIDLSGIVLEESFRFIRKKFPQAKLTVVYIPSPINSYEILSENVVLRDRIRLADQDQAGPPTSFTPDELNQSSNHVCQMVYRATQKFNAYFIDTRKELITAAKSKGFLHGPNDASHFNKIGYETLARIIKDNLAVNESNGCSLN